MDIKFQKILTLALRPETGEGEAVAALNAARRMVSQQGIGLMLGTMASEKVVEKIVYRRHSADYGMNYTITVSSKFQFSMIERIFQDAESHQLNVELLSCQGIDGLSNKGMKVTIQVTGHRRDVENYGYALEGYITQTHAINRNSPQTRSYQQPNQDKPVPVEKKSWFKILFG